MIPRLWAELDRPCSEAAVDHAIACAQRRLEAHDDERAVLMHGDVHEWNALRSDGAFKLVDAEGLLAEPAGCLDGCGTGADLGMGSGGTCLPLGCLMAPLGSLADCPGGTTGVHHRGWPGVGAGDRCRPHGTGRRRVGVDQVG